VTILFEGRYWKEFWWMALMAPEELSDVGEYRGYASRVPRDHVE
jgi:hypothetical protein